MLAQSLRRLDTRVAVRVLRIIMFAAATALSARLVALVPNSPVPLSMQVLVVVLSGFVLGGRDALAAQLLYLQAILMGAPYTATGMAGPAAFAGPTAGYLVSFPLAAMLAGLVCDRWNRAAWARVAGGAVALVAIYGLGTLWLAGFTGSLSKAFALGVVPFIGADVLKIAIATALLSVRKR